MPYGYEMIRVWGTVAKGEEPWVWVVVMSGGLINGSVAYVEMGVHVMELERRVTSHMILTVTISCKCKTHEAATLMGLV